MKNKFTKYWIPVVLWMGFTFLMSTGTFSGDNTSKIITPILKFFMPSISPHQLDVWHVTIRKSAHIIEYFVLSLLLFRAFRSDSTEYHPWRWVLLSVFVLAIFAASDEFHQSFEAKRSASFRDVGIDTLGGFIAQGLSAFMHYRRKKKV